MKQRTAFRYKGSINSLIPAVLIVVLFHAAALAASAGVVALNPDERSQDLGATVRYMEDKQGALSVDDLPENLNHSLWKENTHNVLNFGYTDSIYWVRADFVNASLMDAAYWFEIAYPVIDDIRIHIIRENRMETLHMGDKHPFYQRPVETRNFVFPVNPGPSEAFSLIMRFSSTSSMQMPLYVYREDVLMDKIQREMLEFSLYYGAMLIMILYNLFVYVSVRDSMYLYYVVYVFFMVLWASSLNGVCFQYFWPQATLWNDKVIVFALNGIVFFASLFIMRFLNVKQEYPGHHRLFMVFTMSAAILMPSAFVMPYRAGISSAMILAMIAISYGAFIAVLRLFDGFKLARVFVLAWAMVVIGGLVMALSKFGLIPRNAITEAAVQIGSVLEVALLSFALAHRLNLEKKQRIEAQNIANIHERHARFARENELKNERKAREAREEALEMQKMMADTLEKKVQERQADLNKSLKNVSGIFDKIMKSLSYARMIQAAMLPASEDIARLIPDHFIWYAPRDIVGGDFYYMDRADTARIVVVGDCTGHGVPGALMTLIALSELKRIIRGEKCYDPCEILVRMNRRIRKTLKQDRNAALSDDGLDMAVCVIHPENSSLVFAGARLDLRYISHQEIHTIKGDKRSLGYVSLSVDYAYTVHRLSTEPGMTVYLTTDGIIDQPCEKTGLRFGTKQLNEALLSFSNLQLNLQHEELSERLMTFRGQRDQVDDITVVAFATEFL